MSKSSKIQIDEDEKKLLKILEKNAGKSIEKIAKKCGFSRQKVWRIKKRLEKNNTIWGYNAVVDDEKLNLKRYLLLIKRTNKPVSAKDLDIGVNRELKHNLEKLGINIEAIFLFTALLIGFSVLPPKISVR